MQTVTIKEAQDMVGQVIPRLEAKVLNVYDRKTGTGQYGPWSLQNAEIEDSSGKMKVVFSKMTCQSRLVGRTVVFKSMVGKHGLKGVEAKKNDYNGKKTVELKVSSAALVVGLDEEANVSQAAPSTRIPSNEPRTATEARQTLSEAMDAHFKAPTEEQKRQEVKSGMAMAKNRLTQLAGLYDLSYKSAINVHGLNQTIGDDQIKDIATTFFIQACKEGLADKMPIRTTEKFFGDKIKPEGNHRGEPEDLPGPETEEEERF